MNATPATNSAAPGILVSDFDGTITQFQPFESWREIGQALTTPNREQP